MIGLIMATAITTERVRSNPYVTMRVIGGRGTSITVMSLENLVVTRPEGFESKNSIVALRILSVIELCIPVLA